MLYGLLLPFLLLLFSIAVFGFFGNLLLKQLGFIQGIFARLFSSILLACLLLTGIYALFVCELKTVFSLFLLFFLLLLYFAFRFNKSTLTPVQWPNRKEFMQSALPLMLALAVVYGWSWLNFPAGKLQLPANPESLLYARFARLISTSGIESSFGIGNFPDAIPAAISPYHYFDAWLTAAFSWLFGISELAAWHYFTQPLCYFLIYLGLAAVLETLVKPRFHHMIALILLLFFGSLSFVPMLEKFGEYHFDSLEGPMQLYGEKLAFAYVLVLQALLLYRSGRLLLSLLFLALIPYFFPTLLLPFLIGLPLISLLAWRFQLLNKKALGYFLLYFVAANLALICLYHFYGAGQIQLAASTDWSGLNWPSIKMTFAEAWYRCWNKPFRTLLFYAPLLLLYWINRKQLNRTPLILGFSLVVLINYLASVLIWALLYKLPEAHQLYTNSLLFIHIFGWLCVLHVMADWQLLRAKWSMTLILALCGLTALACFRDYRQSAKKEACDAYFLDQVARLSKGAGKNFCVAYVQAPQDLVSGMELHTGGTTAGYLQLLSDFFGSINIGQFNYLTDSTTAKNYVKVFAHQSFYRFVNNERMTGNKATIAQLQLAFLKKNQLRMIAYSAHALPSAELIHQAERLVVDGKSGAKFLLLKK